MLRAKTTLRVLVGAGGRVRRRKRVSRKVVMNMKSNFDRGSEAAGTAGAAAIYDELDILLDTLDQDIVQLQVTVDLILKYHRELYGQP